MKMASFLSKNLGSTLTPTDFQQTISSQEEDWQLHHSGVTMTFDELDQ